MIINMVERAVSISVACCLCSTAGPVLAQQKRNS